MNNIPEETLPEAPAYNGTRSTPYRGSRRWTYPSHSRNGDSPYAFGPVSPRAAGPAFDFWSLLDPLLRRWTLPVLVGALLFAAALLFALNRWTTSFSGMAQVVYTTPPTTESGYRPRAIGMPTLTGLLRSPELLRRVGAYAQPALTAAEVDRAIRLQPERDSEIVTVTATGNSAESAAALANLYAREAVRFLRDIQARDAGDSVAIAQKRLQQVETDLGQVERRLLDLPLSALAPVAGAATIDPTAARITAAEEELTGLLARYTDAHPLVREQRARLAALKETFKPLAATTPAATAAPNRPLAPGDDIELLRNQARNLESIRAQLLNQQQSAALLAANPPGYLQVFNPAEPANALAKKPHVQIGAFALFFGLTGVVATAGLMLGREFFDKRLKTAADVRRVAHLPVIATLGDTNTMNDAARERWAFRTWTALQRRLSVSPNHGLVCGITSSGAGEGRSTWIKLLAQAAAERGFRVLTITTQPGGAASAVDAEIVGADTASPGTIIVGGEHAPVLTSDVLASPGLIIEQLTRTDAPPRIDIPLPGWVWNLERRKQWLNALHSWRKIDNLVILVELPPADVPEAVLLAENLPNLVWLAEAGQSDAVATHEQLETLRQARCNLVGAVLNREAAPPVTQRFTRWIGAAAIALPLFTATPDTAAQTSTSSTDAPPVAAVADDTRAVPSAPASAASLASRETPTQFSAAEPPPNPNAGRLSVTSATERAEWQQRLTLGPGDVLRLGVYGDPTLLREEVTVGPDGTISFLEARGVTAAGLTVDELRARLDETLGQFRRAPRTIVIPVAYRSKNYVVLGKVARRGVFPLDRPVTLVEAVARAGGFESGVRNGAIVDAADFSRAFLVRGEQRVPVDFDKLFRSGDLTQNVALAPGDYLYFPPAGLQEVYVLGEVRYPGSLGYTSHASTAVAAIAGRGGFTERAWRGRVLVVRGSLERPQAFAIDVGDVLAGRTADFALEPRDIVFVHFRPWIRIEELLDIAASSFVQSAILNWTGLKTGPLIK
jgi:protein involved in polysaccharide export with SLBB domain/capsular polysaccharide biosynthesis protein